MTEETTGSVRAPEMARYIEALRRRKAESTNQKHIAMLEVLIEHTIAEVFDQDLDRTMATLVPDCVYHHSGDRKIIEALGLPVLLRGTEEVRSFYSNGMEAGTFHPERIGIDLDHLFVTDEAIAWDGQCLWSVPGSIPIAAGFSLPEGGTAEDNYVMSVRHVIVIPFRDGLMVGEDFYFDGSTPTLTLAS